MPTPTYDAISSSTLSATSTSFTFTNIPQNYTDLVLEMVAYLSSATQSGTIIINSVTSNSYNQTYMSGSGSAASGGTTGDRGNLPIEYINGFSNSSFGFYSLNFQNYASPNMFKTVFGRGGEAGMGSNATVTVFRSTNPITSLLIATSSGSYVPGSRFSLYGIRKA